MKLYFPRNQKALLISVFALFPIAALAGAPEISFVYPEFHGKHLEYASPHLITGEGFAKGKTKVRVWEPGQMEMEELLELLKRDQLPELPADPPEGAATIEPLDVEEQVLVVPVFSDTVRTRYSVLWIETNGEVSRPYQFNSAMPRWVSDDSAQPGDYLHVFGFGISGLVAIRSGDQVFNCHLMEREPAAPRTKDPYLVFFEVPKEAPEGDYEVFVHNGWGGESGWAKAGDFRVTPAGEINREVIMATDFGAKGDGNTDDSEALQKAMDKAAESGGIVHLPPGTYAVEETVVVPEGVELRGSGMDNTAILGRGFNSLEDRPAWWASTSVAPSVVILNSHCTLSDIRVSGAPKSGSGGNGMVQIAADANSGYADRILIERCNLDFQEQDLRTKSWLHRVALSGGASRHLSIFENQISGTVDLRPRTIRAEIWNNRFTGGHSGGGSLGAPAYDSVFSGNLFIETPSRILTYTRRNCYVRYNEMHHYSRDSWTNQPEAYLVHGGGPHISGYPTSTSVDSLTDDSQSWTPGAFVYGTGSENLVMIISGKGFGQYRRIVENTGDTIKVDRPWRVIPDETSEYTIGAVHHDSVFSHNLNNSAGLFTLWLDCVGIVVERQRDSFTSGMDTWGRDLRKESDPNRLSPSWYNQFVNGWLDGSSISFVYGALDGQKPSGPTLFGNFVVGNHINSPHLQRIAQAGYTLRPDSRANFGKFGAITVSAMHPWQGREEGRPGPLYSIVAANVVSNAQVGVLLRKRAYKSFVLNNLFRNVEIPIMNMGMETVERGNEAVRMDPEEGEIAEPLPDKTGPAVDQNPLRPDRTSREPAPPSSLNVFGGHPSLNQLVAAYIHPLAGDPKATEAARENLKALFGILQEYDQKHGHLPKAVRFPLLPNQDSDSLLVLLGPDAAALLQCPSLGKDMRAIGLNYLWNENLSGKELKSISEPEKTWLLMSLAASHESLVKSKSAGHEGGVLVLFADGRVDLVAPFHASEWM